MQGRRWLVLPPLLGMLTPVALSASLAAPSAEMARLPIACRVLSSEEVGRATHRGHLVQRGIVQQGIGASGARAVFSLCEYQPVALLTIFEFASAQAAKHEFAVDVKLASSNGGGRRSIRGPWEAGAEFGTNLVYALKGNRVPSFNLIVDLSKPVKYPRGLAQGLLAAAVRRF